MRLIFLGLLSFFSLNAHAEINLNVRVEQEATSKVLKTLTNISANYGQEIKIQGLAGNANEIILKFKKFRDIVVSGNKINPIQITMQAFDSKAHLIGKPLIFTSFYSKTAELSVNGTKVFLSFEEL